MSENEVEGIKKELKNIRNATLFDLTVQSWEQQHLELSIEGICEDILRQFSLRYSPDSNDKEECQKSLSRLRTSSLEFLSRKIYQNPLVKISDDEITYIILENFKDHVMEREGDLEQIKSFIKSYPK